MMEIGKYFWIAFIAVTFLNGFIFRKRSEDYVSEKPELKAGYDKLIKGWLLFANIPWIVMGSGVVLGYTQGVWDYFFPSNMNPAVLAFHGSVISIWLLGSYWIYLNGGAELLASHPGLIRFNSFGNQTDVTSAITIKIVWGIAMLGGIMGMSMMWMGFPGGR